MHNDTHIITEFRNHLESPHKKGDKYMSNNESLKGISALLDQKLQPRTVKSFKNWLKFFICKFFKQKAPANLSANAL